MFGETITPSEVGVMGAVAFLAVDKCYSLLKIALTHKNGNGLAQLKKGAFQLEVEVKNLKESMSRVEKESHDMNSTLSELVGKFDMISKPVRRRKA